jgi:hypothetical protein
MANLDSAGGDHRVSFFGLRGISGLYARQVENIGGLGLAGFLLWCSCPVLRSSKP